MTLKTSCNKFNPALKLFFFTIRQNLGLLILICIIAAMFCPGYLLTHISSTIEGFQYKTSVINYNNIMTTIVYLTTIATSIAAVLMNVINFSYLYAKKSSDVFHALPLTRCELLFSRFFAGFTLSVIPMLLIYGSAALIGLMPRVVGDLRILATGLCYNLIITLFCSAISMIFIICAGTAFDMIISLGSYGLGTILTGAVVLTMCDELLKGYGNDNFRYVLSAVSPFVYCGCSLMDYCNTAPRFEVHYLEFFAVAVIATAVILLLCALLYRRRKAEKAGDSYAYQFIYAACNLIVSFIGGFGIGIIFGEGNFGSIPYFVFALLGSLIIAVIFGAVSNRGFKTVKSSLVIGAVSYAVMIALTVILSTGGLGYSTRVPNIKSVNKATITVSGENWEVSPKLLTELHSKIVSDLDAIDVEKYTIENKEIIDKESSYDSEIFWLNMYLNYELKNGKTLKRYFYIPINSFEKELLALYTCDERSQQIARDSEGIMRSIHFCQTFGNGQYDDGYFYHSVQIHSSLARKLLNAYSEDIKTATSASIRRTLCDGYDLNWDTENGDTYKYYSVNIIVEPHFEKTKAVLQEIDLLSLIEKSREEYTD